MRNIGSRAAALCMAVCMVLGSTDLPAYAGSFDSAGSAIRGIFGFSGEESVELTEQTLTADIVTAAPAPAKKKKLMAKGKNSAAADSASAGADSTLFVNDQIVLSGKMPKDGIVEAKPVTVGIEGRKVLTAYDISIYANEKQKEQGKTWQPDDDRITVTWKSDALNDVSGSLNVYHMEDASADPEMVEEKAVIEDGSVTFEADSFSIYAFTVEFTFEGKQFVLTGGDIVRLDEVLKTIGIEGNIEDVEISDWSLFEAVLSDDGNWYVYALNPFSSTEWMKVTVDGEVYEIVVTDDFIGGTGTGYPGDVAFASGADISTISIKDLTGMTGSLATSGSIMDLGTSSNGNSLFGYQGTLSQNGTVSPDGTATITFTGAAETADGRVCDVVIEYSDITLFGDTRTNLTGGFAIGAIKGGHMLPGVRGEMINVTTDNSPNSTGRYGLQEKITVYVYETGTTTPVDGTFMLTVNDINVNRVNTSARNIVNHENYISFTERVRIPDIANYDVYYPGSGALAVSGADIYNPGANTSVGGGSYASGFAVQARSGFSFISYNSGGNTGYRTEFDLMPRAGINHIITSYSGHGGSIATSTSGKAEDIVEGGAKYLEGGSVRDERTYVVPTGKRVAYKMTPNVGYKLKEIEIDGTTISIEEGNLDANLTDNGDGSYTYTFPSVNTTHKINVQWEPDTPVSLPIGHLGMEPGSSGSVVHVDLQPYVPAGHAVDTTLAKDGTPRRMGDLTSPPQTLGAENEYAFFTYALGYVDKDGTIPSVFYAKSDDLTLRYTANGEIEYCVNYTAGSDNTWETWSVKDENGEATVPTVFAVYTKTDTGTEHTVYTTATAIARNTTDAGFVDPGMNIGFEERVERIHYTITVKNPTDPGWNPGNTEFLEITESSREILTPSENQTHDHNPGHAHGHALSYMTGSETIAFNESDAITFEVYADNMYVKETAPANYVLSEIVKKHEDQRGTASVEADGKSGTYRIYSVGHDESETFTVRRTDVGTGYTFTVEPVSRATNTEVEFINTRNTINLTLKELLEDGRMGSGEGDTHDFSITVRAREQWADGRGHFSMLGTQRITVQNMKEEGASVTIPVPANADILLIERFGATGTSTDGSAIKTTEYDTSVTSDPEGVMPYRPMAKEYMLSAITADTTVTFRNTLKPRIVTVKKNLIGGDLNVNFEFVATVLDKNSEPWANKVMYTDDDGNDYKTDADGRITFELPGNGILNLPVPWHASVTVKENTRNGVGETRVRAGTGPEENASEITISDIENNTEIVFTNVADFSVMDPVDVVTYEFYLDAECTQKYEFTLDAIGEEPVTTHRQILRNQSVLRLPPQPAAPKGRVFKGWNRASDGQREEGFDKNVTVNSSNADTTVKLYAVFSDVAYAVFHNYPITENVDGTKTEFRPVLKTVEVEKEGKAYTIDLGSISGPAEIDPTKEFIGWAARESDADNGIKISSGYDAYALTPGTATHFYPVAQAKVRVSFYTGESGTGAPYILAALINKGAAIGSALPADVPEYSGYIFGSWYKSFDPETETYSDPVTASSTDPVNEDITLYAEWLLPDSATYHVNLYIQNGQDTPGMAFPDRHYDYITSVEKTHTYDRSDGNNNSITLTDAAARSNAYFAAYLNTNYVFTLADYKFIEPDNSTVINVYYDRVEYKAIVKKGTGWQGDSPEAGYSQTEDRSGVLYGTHSTSPNLNNSSEFFRISRQHVYWLGDDGVQYPLGTTVYRDRHLVYSNWGAKRSIGDPEGTAGYLSNPRHMHVVAVYDWVEGATAPTSDNYDRQVRYDINTYHAYTHNDASILATYTGLYQGLFDRSSKIKPLLHSGQEAVYTFEQKAEGSHSAAPVDMFDYRGVVTDKRAEMSDENRTWTFYVQTASSASGIKLYIDYYRLPAGQTLSGFMGKLTALDGKDNETGIPTADIRDPKASYRSKASYDTTLNNRAVYATSNTYWLNSELFDGYKMEQYTSFYHGNGQNYYGEKKYVSAVSSTEVKYQSDYPNPNYPDTIFNFFTINGANVTDHNKVSRSNQFGYYIDTRGTTSYFQATDADNTYYVLKIVYVPDRQNIEFINGSAQVQTLNVYHDWTLSQSTTKWDGTADYVSGSITQYSAYSDYLSQGKKLNGAELTDPENRGRLFAGWYYDNGTFEQPFDPNKPVKENTQVFAKWEMPYYVVQIDPNGGVLTGGTEGGSTWFWVEGEKTVSSYTNIITRDYDEYEGGDYYYHKHSYDDYTDPDYTADGYAGYNWDHDYSVTIKGSPALPDGTYNLNNFTNPPHTAAYDTDNSLPNDGITYRYLPNEWKVVRWDYMWRNPDGTWPGQWQENYDFTTPVTNHLRLKAIWEKAAALKIVYDPGEGTIPEAETDDPFGGLYTGDKDEDNRYTIGAAVIMNKVAEPNDDRLKFLGWKPKDGTGRDIYPLGSEYVVKSQDVDDTGTVITMVAQYGKMEVTSLVYDANGGEGTLTDLNTIVENARTAAQEEGRTCTMSADSAANTIHNIELNDTVKLSEGNGFTRSGFELVGWSRLNTITGNAGDTENGWTKYFNDDCTVKEAYKNKCFSLGQDVVIDGATGNELFAVWKRVPICKIGDIVYYTLNDAVTAAGSTATIEMLIDYDIPEDDCVTIPSGKSITFTTAATSGTTHPYTGSGSAGIGTLRRGNGFTSASLFTVAGGGSLTFTNLTLDGNSVNATPTINGGLVNNAGTLALGSGATMTNSASALSGGAVYSTGIVVLGNGATVTGNGKGGAIYAEGGQVQISGSALVYDNLDSGAQKNVVINAATTIQVTGALNESAKIGVYSADKTYTDPGMQFGAYAGSNEANLNTFWNDVRNGVRGKKGKDNKIIWPEPNVDLSVTKTVAGAMGDTTREFDFTLSGLENGTEIEWKKYETTDGSNYTLLSNGAEGISTAANGSITFSLKHNQKITLTVPAGSELVLEESEATGYAVSMVLAKAEDGTKVTPTSGGDGATIIFEMAEDLNLAVTNTLGDIAPTGVRTVVLPFVLILAAGAVFFLFYRRRWGTLD